jgi:hypothetical protein
VSGRRCADGCMVGDYIVENADSVLHDGTNYTFCHAVLIMGVDYRELKPYLYFFPLCPYILNNELAAVVCSKSKNGEVDNNLFILKLDYSIPVLPYFSNILRFKTYILRHSGIVIDDNKKIFEANSECCAGPLYEVYI